MYNVQNPRIHTHIGQKRNYPRHGIQKDLNDNLEKLSRKLDTRGGSRPKEVGRWKGASSHVFITATHADTAVHTEQRRVAITETSAQPPLIIFLKQSIARHAWLGSLGPPPLQCVALFGRHQRLGHSARRRKQTGRNGWR